MPNSALSSMKLTLPQETDLLPRKIGFYLIAIACLFYSVFTKSFAQLHCSTPFGVPVFIGEILLAVSIGLLLVSFRINPPDLKTWHKVLVAYVLWILVMAFWGDFRFGPLAFRNAALFYYPLFAVLGYHFYRSDLFIDKLIIGYIVILLFAKFILSINNYFVFPYFILSCILLSKIKSRWVRYLFIIPALYIPAYYFERQTFTSLDFYFYGGRSRVVGHVVAFSFLFSVLACFFIRWQKVYKLIVLLLMLLALIAGISRFSDKNAIRSMTSLSEGIQHYQFYKSLIAKKDKNFQSIPLSTQLYSKESFGFVDNLSIFLSSEYSGKSDEIKQKLTRLEEIAKQTEQEKKKGAIEVNSQMVKGKEISIQQAQQEIEKIKLSAIQQAEAKLKQNKKTKKENNATHAVDSIIQKQSDTIVNGISMPDASVTTEIYSRIVPSDIKIETQEDLERYISHLEKNSKIALNQIVKEIEKKAEDESWQYTIQMRAKKIATLEKAISDLGMGRTVTINQILSGIEDRDDQGYRTLDTAYSNIFFRIFIWEDMIKDILAEKALFGINWGKPQRSKSIEILGWATQEWSRDGWITPHNSYLHVIYRAGIIGVALIICLFWVLIWLIRDSIQLRSLVGVLLASLLIYWLTIANFLVFLELPYNAIPFWSVFGIVLAYIHHQKFSKAGNYELEK